MPFRFNLAKLQRTGKSACRTGTREQPSRPCMCGAAVIAFAPSRPGPYLIGRRRETHHGLLQQVWRRSGRRRRVLSQMRAGAGRRTSGTNNAKGAIGNGGKCSGVLCYALGWAHGDCFLPDRQAAICSVSRRAIHRCVWRAPCHQYSGWDIFWRRADDDGRVGRFRTRLAALFRLISLITFILWIFLMVKAFQGAKFEVPVAAGIAKSFAGN